MSIFQHHTALSALALLPLAMACGSEAEPTNQIQAFERPGGQPSGDLGESDDANIMTSDPSQATCANPAGCGNEQTAPQGLDDSGQNSDNLSEDQQTPEVPCTPNQAWCEGTVLRRCSRDGQSITDTPCDICGDIGGVDGCIDRVCEPSSSYCDGPTRMACDAEGLLASVDACPDGSICSGEGACTPVQCNPQGLPTSNNGAITVYWFRQGTNNFGDVACGFGINVGEDGGNGDSVNGIANPELFGAMNTADYETAAACGTCVNMQRDNRNVTITIVDECPIDSNPTCTSGHIDLSRAAWNQLTGNAGGNDLNGVQWQTVPCPVTGPVSFELAKADDQYWNEVLVRNHAYEIERVEIEMEPGRWVDANRSDYNFWRSPEGDPDGAMGTYRVRAWDINGGATEAQLQLMGGPQPGSSQFSCQ